MTITGDQLAHLADLLDLPCHAEAEPGDQPASGPRVILHCNEPMGHSGPHRLSIEWPQEGASPCPS